MEHEAFLQRVLSNLPSSPPSSAFFKNWKHAGRPTSEGVYMVPVPGADPAKILDAVMDVDHYKGNVDHVAECRSIEDSRFPSPEMVRFYQKVNIPILGSIHHELVLHRMGEHNGYQIAGWGLLEAESKALNPKQGFRSQYNHGVWLVAPGVVGYALGSAPRREDVGFLKWKALTKGADVGAKKVLEGNIKGMAAWAARR